jgi:AhpD family alkylhydroperoxidase
MPRLTKRTVDAAEPTGQEYFLWDADLRGFGLRVLRSGRKSYVVQYRIGGRGGPTRRKALGLPGVLTAEEARNEARKWLAERAKGNDPIGEHLANRKAETVAELCRRYISAAEQGLVLGKGDRPKKPSTLSTLRAVEAYLHQTTLGEKLIELVKMRASQINGCAYCLHMHSKTLRRNGESEQRIYLLNAWQESPLYTPRERAALAWTGGLDRRRRGARAASGP